MALTDRDKKMLMVLGAVAVVAALYLFFFVLRGGGGGGEVVLPTGPTGSVTPTTTPSVTPTETPRPTSPPVSLVGDRDPFSIPPGLSASPTGGEVSPTSPTSAPPTTAPPTTGPPTTGPPTTVPPTSPPPTSPPPTSPPPTSPPPTPGDHILIGGHEVTLQAIVWNGKRVDVDVDGRHWTVEEGATFDDNFKLVKVISKDCARFLYGDQSFELCLDGGGGLG